jgi:hypothetical protein
MYSLVSLLSFITLFHVIKIFLKLRFSGMETTKQLFIWKQLMIKEFTGFSYI